MICFWFPMISLWVSFYCSYDVPMIFWSFSYDVPDLPMCSLWFSYDVLMIFRRFSYDFPIMFPGFHDDFRWFSYDFAWLSYDVPWISFDVLINYYDFPISSRLFGNVMASPPLCWWNKKLQKWCIPKLWGVYSLGKLSDVCLQP